MGGALPVPVSLKVPAVVTQGHGWGAWEEEADGGGKPREERGAWLNWDRGGLGNPLILCQRRMGRCCASPGAVVWLLHPLDPSPRASEFLPVSPTCVPHMSPQPVPAVCPPQSNTGQGFDRCFLSHTLLIRKTTPGNGPVGNCRSRGSVWGWGWTITARGHRGLVPPCPMLLCHLLCSPLLGSDALWGQLGGWDRGPQARAGGSCHRATSRAGSW